MTNTTTVGGGEPVFVSVKTTRLEYRQGGSDKVYIVELFKDQFGQFKLQARYGPRNGNLNFAPKDVKKDPYGEFDKLVMSKTKKGYSIASVIDNNGGRASGSETVTSTPAPAAKDKFGMPVQLLNEITEDEAIKLIDSGFWAMQQKFDGERRPVKFSGAKHPVIGGNRNGELVELPQSIVDGFHAWGMLGSTWELVLDGETAGDDYFIFDVLKFEGQDLTNHQLSHRLNILESLKEKYGHLSSNIHFAETWHSPADKRAAFEKIKQQNKEGVVFKLKMGLYEDGRPNSGGEALKFKLWESVTVVVSKVNAGRSVGISMLDADGRNLVTVGNATISANFEMPQVGDFAEIRYLYVTNIGGSLYQPVYKAPRPDKKVADTLAKLKYKPADQKLTA